MAFETLSAPAPPAAQDLFFEKRGEARIPACEPVEVYLLDMQGLRLPGILRDVSRNGLRIELSMPLKAGDRLEVVRENYAIIFGEVRYSRRADDCYHAGVLIGDVLDPKVIPSEAGESRIKPGRARTRMVPKRTVPPPPAGPPGTHLSAREADGFFRGRLSDTKAALVDRHLATCKRCLDLVLLTLEKKLSSGPAQESVKDVCEGGLH
jgi:PilZ domain